MLSGYWGLDWVCVGICGFVWLGLIIEVMVVVGNVFRCYWWVWLWCVDGCFDCLFGVG